MLRCFLFGASQQRGLAFNIPNAPGVVGLNMYNQALVLDPGFNALGRRPVGRRGHDDRPLIDPAKARWASPA
jgi:hypothetical protein